MWRNRQRQIKIRVPSGIFVVKRQLSCFVLEFLYIEENLVGMSLCRIRILQAKTITNYRLRLLSVSVERNPQLLSLKKLFSLHSVEIVF